MFWDSAFDFFTGHLPKPIIWAEPGSVIAQHAPVTIWCQGSWEAKVYHLYKEQSVDPWDTQFPLETMNKAKFIIQHMTTTYAGIYKCYYESAAGFSEQSDAMELVMTGERTLRDHSTGSFLRRRSVPHELFSQSPILGDIVGNSCSFHTLPLISSEYMKSPACQSVPAIM